MADRERCFCGEMSFTRGGYCHQHRDLDKTQPETVSTDQQLRRAESARDAANARVRELEAECDTIKRELAHANKLLTLVAIGDVKPSEIAEARRG